MTGAAAAALDALDHGFRRAASGSERPVHEERFAFAGRPVRVAIAGDDLAATYPRPWRHLRRDGEAGAGPTLEIRLWDASATGVSEPELYQPEGAEQEASAEASPDGDTVLYRRREIVIGFDRAGQRILGMVRSVDDLSLYDLGRPLHAPLLLWYRDRGHPALHAGLVEKGGRGALLVGAGGSGKTTSALRCMMDGFRFVSDDYVGLESLDPGFRGHGLYGSTHVDPEHLRAAFPELARHAVEGRLPEEDKWLVLLTEVSPERLQARASIDVLLLPVVTDRDEPRLRPASKADALRRLAPSSLLMLPYARSPDLGRLASLVDALPRYWLELGRDLEAIAPLVERALTEAP